MCKKLNILERFLSIYEAEKATVNVYRSLTAGLASNRGQKKSQKATSIRKGGRNLPDALENYIEDDEEEEA